MLLSGPLHGDFYLSYESPVRAQTSGQTALVRVIRSTGYPYDLLVGTGPNINLRAGRVFAPIVAAGAELQLNLESTSEGERVGLAFKIMCANCFAEIWSRPVEAGARAVVAQDLLTLEDDFWGMAERPACPRCFAAAARAH